MVVLQLARVPGASVLATAVRPILQRRDGRATMSEPQRVDLIEGVVKWFDQRKGYGFVVAPDGGDVFIHYSVIDGEGFRVLEDGAPIRYSAIKTDKGWKATHVLRTNPSGEVVVVRRGYSRNVRR